MSKSLKSHSKLYKLPHSISPATFRTSPPPDPLLPIFQPHCLRCSSLDFPGMLQCQNFCMCCPSVGTSPPECHVACSPTTLPPSALCSGGPSLNSLYKLASPPRPSLSFRASWLPSASPHIPYLSTVTCVCLPHPRH